eukprot:jgi/Mesvir1/19249/Mv03499-RA.1
MKLVNVLVLVSLVSALLMISNFSSQRSEMLDTRSGRRLLSSFMPRGVPIWREMLSSVRRPMKSVASTLGSRVQHSLPAPIARAAAKPLAKSVRDEPKIERRLAQTIIVMRHCATSPLHRYPFENTTWDGSAASGWGRLTPVGLGQCFEFGENLRKRYIERESLVPPVYSKSNMYVRAVRLERTVDSAMAVLLAMFPPMNSSYAQIRGVLDTNCACLGQPPARATPSKVKVKVKGKVKAKFVPRPLPPWVVEGVPEGVGYTKDCLMNCLGIRIGGFGILSPAPPVFPWGKWSPMQHTAVDAPLPPEVDAMLMQAKVCPHWARAERHLVESLVWREKEAHEWSNTKDAILALSMSENGEVCDLAAETMCRQVSGMDLANLYDNIMAHEVSGRQYQPAELLGFRKRLKAAKEWIMRARYHRDIGREAGGILLGDIIWRMTQRKNFRNEAAQGASMVLYVAQESTLLGLMATLGIENPPILNFGSHVVFELWEPAPTTPLLSPPGGGVIDWQVRITFDNEDVQLQGVRGCPTGVCSLHEFVDGLIVHTTDVKSVCPKALENAPIAALLPKQEQEAAAAALAQDPKVLAARYRLNRNRDPRC